MEDYTAIELLVKRSVADEISQKGLAEIALRRSDAKFRAIVKAIIPGDNTLSEELVQKIQPSALKMSISDTTSISNVRNVMRSFNKNLESNILSLSSATKNMSVQVDSIFHLTNAIRTISFVNTGISLANMAVDVAGFVIINQKLNTVNYEIRNVLSEVKKLSDLAKNEKISECQKLIMKYNSLSSKVLNSEPINIDVIDNLLIDMKTFISEMIRNLMDNNMIYILMPAYTQLLNEYNKRIYYSKQSLPANYGTFMTLFIELENNGLRKDLQDYYILKRKMHSQDVIDLLNAKTLVGLNQKVLIEDQVSMMKLLGTPENIEAFDLELDNIVKSFSREKIPVIAKDSGISEHKCSKVLGFENI